MDSNMLKTCLNLEVGIKSYPLKAKAIWFPNPQPLLTHAPKPPMEVN